MEANPPIPGLRAVSLINTRSGAVVRLATDRHASLCGANNSGKSTLQRPLLVFAGAAPHDVVPAGRQSFEDWYLPTEGSYIVFDYLNHHGDARQAVITRASDGQGVDFRFIAAPYDLDDYIKSREGAAIVTRTARELAAYFRERNVRITPVLNGAEYRAVIQNNLDVIRTNDPARKTAIKGFAREYALSAKRPLRHIEKIVQLVHTKAGKMTAMREMIGSILEDEALAINELTPSIHASAEEWRAKCKLALRLEGLKSDCLGVVADGARLAAARGDLAEVACGLGYDKGAAEDRIRSLVDDLKALREDRVSMEARHRERKEVATAALQSARARHASAQAELAALGKRETEFDARGTALIAQRAAELPSLRADLAMKERELAFLEAEHADLKAALDAQMTEIAESLTAQLERAGREGEAVQLDIDRLSAERDAAMRELEVRQSDGRRAIEERSAAEVRDISERVMRADVERGSYALTEAEQARVTLAERDVERTEGAHRDAIAAREAAGAALKSVEGQGEALRGHRAAELAKLARARADHAAWKARYAPPQGSLVGFLRDQVPGWESTIGRVVHPDLLMRSDLSPALGEPSDSTFGVSVDLDRLDPPEIALGLHAIEDRLRAAEGAASDAEAAAAKANDRITEHEARCVEAGAAHAAAVRSEEAAKAELDRAREQRDAARREGNEASGQRRIAAGKRKEALDAEHKAILEAQAAALARRGAEERAATLELSAHWQQRLQLPMDRKEALKKERERARSTAEDARKRLMAAHEAHLTERGVDAKRISALRSAIALDRENIGSVESRRDEIEDYRSFVATRDIRTPALLEEEEGAQTAIHALEDAERALKVECDNEWQALSASTLAAEREERECKARLEAVTAALRRIAQLGIEPARGPRGRGVEDRLAIERDLGEEHRALKEAIKSGVDAFDRAMNAAVGSEIYDAWDRQRRGLGSNSEHLLAARLGELTQQLIPQFIESTRLKAKTIGAELARAFDQLKRVDGAIAKQGAAFSSEVGAHLALDAVEDVNVIIRSKIGQLDGWKEIETFATCHREWEEGGCIGLPGEAYVAAMANATPKIWRSTSLKGLAALIDIELRYRENGQAVSIRTDTEFASGASNGTTYLILMKLLIAFTNRQRRGERIRITWPVDEVGTIAAQNVKRVLDALTANDITVLGAFPDPDYQRLKLFDERYMIRDGRVLQINPAMSPLDARLAERRANGGQP